MADVEAPTTAPLAQHYLVEDKQKPEIVAKSTEESDDAAVESAAEEVAEKVEETTNAVSSEAAPAAVEKNVEPSDSAAEESKGSKPDEPKDDTTPAPSEENADTTESNDTAEEETNDTPEIKLETAPADFRFPTTNQTRHCFTRYIEYHRCVAAKGDGAPECEKFAKYYRSLCPSEWVERWNEQRENGTFPGPL